MLLDAIRELTQLKAHQLEPIATAASIGLYAYDATDEADAAAVLAELLRRLDERTRGHATFIGALTPEEGDFNRALEKLTAQIRRRQLRQPTIRVPSIGPTRTECYIDGWRPGVVLYPYGSEGGQALISEATDFRRCYGRKVKNELFKLVLGDAYGGDLCVADLGQLARDPSKGALDGKIALIHVDGNSFGAIRRAQCNDPGARRNFDKRIQAGGREPFLAALLDRARRERDFQANDAAGNPALRLEVLLWGGDEFTLVVPAWKGLETLELFYRTTGSLEFEGVELSHRAAVVFCHHNAPILQIRRLAAQELLAQARQDIHAGLADKAAPPTHEQGDALRYLALESFDMLRGSLPAFLDHYYAGLDQGDLLVRGAELPALREHLAAICKTVSKGRLIGELKQRAGRAITLEDAAALREELIATLTPEQRAAIRPHLDAVTAGRPGRWRLMLELWDYALEWQP